MDTFARSAQNEATNRDRLRDMIDLHLDSLMYINDILSIENVDLVSRRARKLASVLDARAFRIRRS